MEYLQLMLMVLTVSKVQGYNNITRNDTSFYKSSFTNSHQLKYFHKKQFDDAFKHYRSSDHHHRPREPKFISFNTKDDNIDVEIDFAVPFLSIPVKRSLDSAMGTLQGVIKGIPMANVNFGALMLTGVVIVMGATIGGISRVFNGGNFIEIITGTPYYGGYRGKSQKRNENDQDGFQWWNVIEQIENGLQKFDIDSTACSQRIICWHVKDSLANVNEKKATNFDFLLSGLTDSEWALQMISNSAWSDAVASGKKGENCEAAYSQCKLSPNNLESFSKKIMQLTNMKK